MCISADLESVSVLVWTTQPWTIPANEAVCYMPNAQYVSAPKDYMYTLAYLGHLRLTCEAVDFH